MSKEVPKPLEEQIALFDENDSPTPEAVGDLDLVDSPIDVLRSEYQDLFNSPPDQSWNRDQLLSAIYSPTGQPAIESPSAINYEELENDKLEEMFKEKLSKAGKHPYSPFGLEPKEIINYLQGVTNTEDIILRLGTIAAEEDAEERAKTYRR